jgi:Aspartyl protease
MEAFRLVDMHRISGMASKFPCAPPACGLPLAVLIAAIAGCSRAGGAPERRLAADSQDHRPQATQTFEQSIPSDDAPLDVVGRLDQLRTLGRFEEFIDGALIAAETQPDRAALQLLKGEALLASGLPGECEDSAIHSATLAADHGELELSVQALKLWAVARFRQSKSLDDPLVAELLSKLLPGDTSVRMLEFWRDDLGNRTPYRLDSAPTDPVEMKPADAARGSTPFELGAIQARANGTTMPLVFIDTGAQYTLMTAQAAQAAGVTVGDSGMQLIGFRGLTARPGVIETLELGDLVLYDVPVLVGDSAPLVAVDGQMSLGTELMHHVRFHIDFPARRVTAEPAGRVSAKSPPPPIWDIPVWTFSQICLARGQLAAGPMARVLVDTGNRSGTFVSYRWARRHMPQLRGANSSLVFRFKKRNMTLDMLDLGSQSLAAWPVADTMPAELDGLNQVDVILGHDLLWPYELTIDLPRRVLELRPGTGPPAGEP